MQEIPPKPGGRPQEQALNLTGCLAAHAPRGDWTVVAWVIAATYFLLAVLCYRAAVRASHIEFKSNSMMRNAFWPALCLMMIALGLNKQFDLQTDLTNLGRQIARNGGWYQNRRYVQVIFIAILCAAAVGSLTLFAWFNRRQWREYGLAFIGMVYLVTFILIRAASFHHIDTILFHLPLGKSWVNAALEIGGQILIGIGAVSSGPKLKKAQPREMPE